MVHLPASGGLFTGDVLMPYLGASFFAEGSPEGLLDALPLIAELSPRVLVHGHTTLTEQFTAEAVPGLLAALTELRDESLAGIGRGLTLTGLLKASVLPEVLREHPAAVGPYLVARDHFVQRLHHQRSGYCQPDGQGPRSLSTRGCARLAYVRCGAPKGNGKASPCGQGISLTV